ncbi:hypothetical protein EDC01DRAFT_255664 [Geopyxis carbonaria]|nr:hypothetical protein EDC01DRAFT_255664 [Geopyxis carbonaria]
MSSKLPRHREPRSPGWFDNDNEDRGRGRRRSSSRDRKDYPREPEKGRRHGGGDSEHARSPERRKKHDARPTSGHRHRSRSADSRHDRRNESSLHRSRRHRRSQSPRHSSHRHKRRHGSGSPAHKRRRSRSPGHGSGKHKKSRRPRSRSKTPTGKISRREISTSPKPGSLVSLKHHSHKSSTRPSRHDDRFSASPGVEEPPQRAPLRSQEYRSRSPIRRGHSPIHSQKHTSTRSPRRALSPVQSSKTRYISPPRRVRSPPPPPPRLTSRVRSPLPQPPRLTSRDYPPIPRPRRSSRSRSPPYHDLPPRRGRSPVPSHPPPPPPPPPPAVHARSPISSRGAFKRPSDFSPPHPRAKSPRRRSPPPALSKSSRQSFSDRSERSGRDVYDYETTGAHSRKLSPHPRDNTHRMPQNSDHGPGRSPDHEPNSRRGRQFSPSPKYSDNPNTEDLNNPRYASRLETKVENSSYPTSDRGRGRGGFDPGRGTPRGRGRGRGQDHHRNQPLLVFPHHC